MTTNMSICCHQHTTRKRKAQKNPTISSKTLAISQHDTTDTQQITHSMQQNNKVFEYKRVAIRIHIIMNNNIRLNDNTATIKTCKCNNNILLQQKNLL